MNANTAICLTVVWKVIGASALLIRTSCTDCRAERRLAGNRAVKGV
jgi:hypothetical protein